MRQAGLILICVYMFLLIGCSSMGSTGIVKRTDNGVKLKLNSPGKLSYKEKDGIETEMDTREPSLLRTLVEGVVVQGLDSNHK